MKKLALLKLVSVIILPLITWAGGECVPSPKWPLEAIKASSLAAQNQLGQGIKVAIVDSGIDRDHPAFKDVAIQGKDFFGGNESAPYPYFDNEGHGTHVAGIVAGRDCLGNPIGLAPKASLYIARACGAEGCKSDSVGAGIEWAIDQQVDVINISIEGDHFNTAPREREAVKKAIAAGIAVVTISGNGGSQGPNNSIAAIEGVIVAGAANKWLEKPFFSQIGLQTLAAPGVNILSAYPQGRGYIIDGNNSLFKPDLIPLLNTPRPQNLSSEIAFTGFGFPKEAAKAKDKIAVAELGGDISVMEKAKFAEAAGAQAIIILMSRPYFAVGLQTFDTIKIPVIFGTKDEKDQFLELESKNQILEINTLTGDYILESGTSMAAPFVTGAVALLKAKKKDLTPAQVKNILTGSAIRNDANRHPHEDSPFGAGILNVEGALNLVP